MLDRARGIEPVAEALATRAARRYLFKESKVKRRASAPGHSGGEFSATAGPSRALTQPFSQMKARGVKARTHAGGGVTKLSTVSKPAAPGARPDEPSHRRPKLSEDELPAAVGAGVWTQRAEINAKALRAQEWPEGKRPDGKILDSEVLYRSGRDTGYWDPDRVQLHARIARLLLQGAGYHRGDGSRAVFTAGGPASGKSTIAHPENAKSPVDVPPDAVYVNPDIVKEMLPEYQALKRAGDPEAAAKVHEESSYVAKLVSNLAIARGHHVFVDAVGNSESGKFLRKIKAAQAAGHDAKVVYASLPSDEAARRAVERGKRRGRYVDEAFLRASHVSVVQRFVEDILPDKSVPLEVWDTSGSQPKLVARRVSGGGLVTSDKKLWAAWLEKGGYKPGDVVA